MPKLFLTLLCSVLGCAVMMAQPAKPTADILAEIVSGEILRGSWQRLDGGYVLQIEAVAQEGALQAGYFNPRPVRIASARWRFGGSRLQLRIDLNDTGYEGAFYLLQYDPDRQRLVGEYHPASQDVFNVVFERVLQPAGE